MSSRKIYLSRNVEDVVTAYAADGQALTWVAASGLWLPGSVATSFLGLSDTPNSYATYSGYFVKVNDIENALEFSNAINGTIGRIPKFTGVHTIGNSIISESGSEITIAGDLIVGDGVGAQFTEVDGAAGSARDLRFSTAGSNRWILRTDSTAESGSNAGSDFQLLARSDADAVLFTVLSIVRSTGTATFGQNLAVTGTLDVTGLATLDTANIVDTLKYLAGAVRQGNVSGGNSKKMLFRVNVPDNTATTVFTITTTDETGSNDSGAYACTVTGVVTSPQSTATGTPVAAKSFKATFCRAMQSDGTGANSAVLEIAESASAATNAAVRDIGTVTMTVTNDVNAYNTEVKITIDVTGSTAGTAEFMCEVELYAINFLTPPTMA